MAEPTKKRFDHLDFQGLPLTLEYRKGDTRTGKSSNGGIWSRPLNAHYGYIRGTVGTDGDHVDVYVGPDEKATKVYVIDQMHGPDFKRFDEQKMILGCSSAEEAKKLYLSHYPDAGFCGAIKELELKSFKEKVMDPDNQKQKIAVTAEWLKNRLITGSAKRLGRDLTSKEKGDLARKAVRYFKGKNPAGNMLAESTDAGRAMKAPGVSFTPESVTARKDIRGHITSLGKPGKPGGAGPKAQASGGAGGRDATERDVVDAAKKFKREMTGYQMLGIGGGIGAMAGDMASAVKPTQKTEDGKRVEATDYKKLYMGGGAAAGAGIGGMMGGVQHAAAARAAMPFGGMGGGYDGFKRRAAGFAGAAGHLGNWKGRLGTAAAGAGVGALAGLGINALSGIDRRRAAERQNKQLERREQRKTASDGMSSRASAVGDAVDTAALGVLAAPYAAKALGGLKDRPGALGSVGRASDAAAHFMHKHDAAFEIPALVALMPHVHRGIGKGVDKVLPKAKTASAADEARRSLNRFRIARNVSGAALSLGGGLGFGALGSQSPVKYDPETGFSPQSRAAGHALAGAAMGAGVGAHGPTMGLGSGVRGSLRGAALGAGIGALGGLAINAVRMNTTGKSKAKRLNHLSSLMNADPTKTANMNADMLSAGLGALVGGASGTLTAKALGKYEGQGRDAGMFAGGAIGTFRGENLMRQAKALQLVTQGLTRGTGFYPKDLLMAAGIATASMAPEAIGGALASAMFARSKPKPKTAGVVGSALGRVRGMLQSPATRRFQNAANPMTGHGVSASTATSAIQKQTANRDVLRGAAKDLGWTTGPRGAAAGAPVAKKTAPPAKSLFTARNALRAGVVGAGGLALYGGKKLIDTAASVASPHETDWSTPSPYGLPRAF
jgi:hypothetical protein